MRPCGRAFCLIAMALFPVQGAAAAAAPSDLPKCSAPSLTPPVNQTAISMQDAYPPLSTIFGEEGVSIVSFTINPNGTVSDVAVAQGSGSLRLDEAALNAARQLIYTPAKSGGKPVACRHFLRITWRLSGETAEQRQSRDFMNFIEPPKSAWPKAALQSGKEGATALAVRLSAEGVIEKASIVKGSGSQELDDAALSYVKTLKLKAAQIGAKPASAVVPIVVIWSKTPVKTSAQ